MESAFLTLTKGQGHTTRYVKGHRRGGVCLHRLNASCFIILFPILCYSSTRTISAPWTLTDFKFKYGLIMMITHSSKTIDRVFEPVWPKLKTFRSKSLSLLTYISWTMEWIFNWIFYVISHLRSILMCVFE